MEDPDDIVDHLILNGEIEPVAYDAESGEMLYTFTDKLKESNPHIHAMLTNDFHATVMSLWELGILEMDITSNNPVVKATEKAFDESLLETLSPHQTMTLKEILRAMSA